MKNMMKNNSKIVAAVAMSGGVDSSAAAVLLKKQGFKVFGITMKTFCYEKIQGGKRVCCGLEGIHSAKNVCKKLGIPHYVVVVSKEFTKKVINDFIKEYKSGRTPNPCVRCNQFIKFDLLLKLAKKYGADFLATGHYARIKFHPRNSHYSLLRAKDKNKDQTYFLYTLNQEQLSKILFPIGDFTKQQVRELAEKANLSVYKREESQEICFVNINLRDFLSSQIKLTPGDIVDSSGKILGRHYGIAFYTIGQRAGIGGKGPYYVAKIDKEHNRIIVTNNPKDPIIFKKTIIVSNVHWINLPREKNTKKKPKTIKAQIRYKSKPVSAKIFNIGKNKVKVVFVKPVFAPAPGQSAVFYLRDECLGGGVIKG